MLYSKSYAIQCHQNWRLFKRTAPGYHGASMKDKRMIYNEGLQIQPGYPGASMKDKRMTYNEVLQIRLLTSGWYCNRRVELAGASEDTIHNDKILRALGKVQLALVDLSDLLAEQPESFLD